MMSHYPSTAELDAFRYRVARDTRGLWPTRPLYGGAWPEEVAQGLPLSSPAWSWQRAAAASLDRAGAAAMRSRAYAAALCAVCRVADFPDGPGCDCYGNPV